MPLQLNQLLPFQSLPLAVALLRSGAIPTALQASIIRRGIDGLEFQLRAVVDEIRYLQALSPHISSHSRHRLSYLRSTRRVLEKSLLVPSSVFSPIRRLPYDVLSLIFSHCASEDPCPNLWRSADSHYDVFGHRNAVRPTEFTTPWILSHVCARWRHVALTTPSLWSTLHVSLRAYGPEHHFEVARHANLIQLYLEHSGSYPLHLDISMAAADLPSPHPILHIITAHCSHWGEVSLHLSPLLYESIADRVKGNVPRLASLKLRICGRDRTSQFDMFSVCPSLRKIDVVHPLRTFALPWEQVEFVRAPLQSTDDVMQLFRLVRRHERLSASLESPRPGSEPIDSPFIRFSALKDINLGSNLQFLEILPAPLLGPISLLRFSVSEADSLSVHATRPTYVARVLNAAALDLTARQLLNVLHYVPTLEHLEIRDARLLTSEFYEALTIRPDSQILLPRLRSVVIVDERRPVTRALMQFLESRKPGSAEMVADRKPLSFVYLEMAQSTDDVDEGLADCVIGLRAQGVKVAGRCTRSFPI